MGRHRAAHQHAAGAKRGPGETDLGSRQRTIPKRSDHKIHAACDGAGRVLAFVLTSGKVNDCTRFEQVVDAMRVDGIRSGRPRTRRDPVIADKDHSTRAIRRYLRRRGIAHPPDTLRAAGTWPKPWTRGGYPPSSTS
jgi:transposase